MTDENDNLDPFLAALDPVLIETIQPALWRQLSPDLASWLLNNTLTYPWFNQLAFAAVIHTSSQVLNPQVSIFTLHSFLQTAIPSLYPDLASLNPEQAMLTYMNDPLQPRVGRSAYTAYLTLQNKMERYLAQAPSAIAERLNSFCFPPLIVSSRLQKLVRQKRAASNQHRKNQAFSLAKNLSTLVALAKGRYQWMLNLETQFQQTVEQLRKEDLTCPVSFTVPHPHQPGELTFRIWTPFTWVKAHQDSYDSRTLCRHRRQQHTNTNLFLQLVGDIPDDSWFLAAVAAGVIQGPASRTPEARRYADKWQLPNLNSCLVPDLLKPGDNFCRFLRGTRIRATGLSDDSKAIFCIEPLLAAATVGLFVLVSIVSTGMRIGELQQLTYDQDCMERGYLPQFDDRTNQWVQGPEQTFWRVYPKAGQRRERYFVSAAMLEALLALYDLHLRYQGPIEQVSALLDYHNFSHTRRYPGQYRFVLQWAGVHLSNTILNICLAFLLLEHPCRNQAGQPVHITAHLLRHAVAGWLHQQDFSLDQIMRVLKHVNGTVTAYYAALSPDELYRKLGPLLTSLAQLVDLDPATIRSPEQLRDLQEQALKRYGLLRQVVGGNCTTLYPCEVHFKCADCRYYIPDPARRDDVEKLLAVRAEVIHFYHHYGEHLLVEAESAHQRSWQRVLAEMDRLEADQLLSPQTVADRMRTFPIKDLGPRLMQDSDPVEQLED